MEGQLIYLVGPSGSGKDSILREVAPLLPQQCVIMKRTITRPLSLDTEEAESLSAEEFIAQEQQGRFALSWRANGLAYGIRADLNQHLHAGKTVLVNGSRAYWPQVVQRYPNAILVLVKVPVSLLRQRLMARGRESLPEIQLRLERSLAMEQTLERHAALQNTEFWVVDNSGSLAEAVAQFQALLSEIWV